MKMSAYDSRSHSLGDSGPAREKGLREVPQGIRNGPGINLGLLTPSLVQVTHNNTTTL